MKKERTREEIARHWEQMKTVDFLLGGLSGALIFGAMVLLLSAAWNK